MSSADKRLPESSDRAEKQKASPQARHFPQITCRCDTRVCAGCGHVPNQISDTRLGRHMPEPRKMYLVHGYPSLCVNSEGFVWFVSDSWPTRPSGF